MSAVSENDPAGFRRRLGARERLVGTFLKTPTIHATEILAEIGFDFVVIDAEHAPFDRAAIDSVVFAARALKLAPLVRVASASASEILSALDCGATGVLVPHVATAERAREVASACRYRGGSRGYSGSPRSSLYGASAVWKTVDAQDAQTTVIAMIEDPAALDNIDAIAAVGGIDAFFIGRGDLTVALGASGSNSPEVMSAVERVSRAALAAGKAVCVMAAGLEEASGFRKLGASAFIVSSDQGFMRKAAAAALGEFARLE
jgi:2-keto-3-deoxy-L-rhamnonate aldolase RhmA